MSLSTQFIANKKQHVLKDEGTQAIHPAILLSQGPIPFRKIRANCIEDYRKSAIPLLGRPLPCRAINIPIVEVLVPGEVNKYSSTS